MSGAFQRTAFQDNSYQITELVTAGADGRGSWDAFRKQKKKRGKVIRRSEYESIEAYRQAMAAMFPVEPKTKIIEPVPPLQESGDDDDTIILAAVSRLLH